MFGFDTIAVTIITIAALREVLIRLLPSRDVSASH
jgi:hypothetical protein